MEVPQRNRRTLSNLQIRGLDRKLVRTLDVLVVVVCEFFLNHINHDFMQFANTDVFFAFHTMLQVKSHDDLIGDL